jgi:hypothetical protein
MSILCCILATQRATTCDDISVHVASGLQHGHSGRIQKQSFTDGRNRSEH